MNNKDTSIPRDVQNDEKKKLLPFFWVSLALGIIVLWIFLVSTGVTLWFVILLVGWVWFLLFIKKAIYTGSFVMKKMILFLIALVVLTTIIMLLSTPREMRSGDNQRSGEAVSGNVTRGESYAGQIFANVLTNNTSWMTGDSNQRVVDYTISATANLYPSGEMKKVTVKNVKLAKMPKGNVTLLLPTGGYNEQFTNDGSNVIDLPVMPQDQRKTANQMSPTFGMISVQIKALDAYRFDVNKAYKMSDAGLQGGRSFQYAGVSSQELDNTLEFDIEIELVDGKKITKHYSGAIPGATFHEKGFVESRPAIVE